MKILLLLTSIFKIGGIEKFNKYLLEALLQLPLELNVLSINDKNIKYSLPYIFEPCGNSLRFVSKINFILLSLTYCLKFRPYLIICGHMNFSPLCYLLKILFNIDYIIIVHGVEAWNIKSKFKKIAIKNAKIISSVSNFTKKKLIEQINGVDNKIFILPDTIDSKEYCIKEKNIELINKYKLDKNKIILTVARLAKDEKYKGYDKVLAALPKVIEEIGQIKYILVGSGDDTPRIKKIINKLNLEKYVILTGSVSQKELLDYYNICDVFTMPSKQEGFGIVFLEALACGKPVIAGNKDSSRDPLLDGELGILVDPDNIDEISHAIINVLKKEVPERLLDRQYLRNTAIKAYGIDKFNEKVKMLIERLQNICRKNYRKEKKIMVLKNNIPNGFLHPIALPNSSEQEKEWQEANRSFWESHPMRYDWKEKIPFKDFTKEFYQEIDLRFFEVANEYISWRKIPFDSLIDFNSLKDKDVLEIGIGNGSHAQLLAQHSKSFTGIDITEYALKSTSERMRCFNLKAMITRVDAEHLEFKDNSFDFIWSWGVIHHSSNPPKILKEISRVLRPDGKAVIMVYHRNFWNYYIVGGLFRGIIQSDLLITRSIHKTIQRYTDGAIARYYKIREWESLVKDIFIIERIHIYGSKSDIIPLPAGRLKKIIMKMIPNTISRLMTNKMKMGSYLVSELRKKP